AGAARARATTWRAPGSRRRATLYARALALGGSDALNHDALAEVWLRHSEFDEKHGKPQGPALERALAASENSIQAAPLRSDGYTLKAYVLMRRYRAMLNQARVQDVGPVLDEWIIAGRRAVALNPRDVSACDALGIGYLRHGQHEARNGREPGASWDKAIVQLSRALELQPNHPWALNDLGTVHVARGHYQREHGQDPRPAYQEALRRFEQAVQTDDTYLFPLSNLTTVYAALAAYAVSRGVNPEAEVRKALETAERSLSLDSSYHWALNDAARVEATSARYLIDAGADPLPALSRARQYLARSLRINPAQGRTYLQEAVGFSLEATHALHGGGDPGPALKLGRQSLERALHHDAGCVDCRVEQARLELTAAAWEQRRGRSGSARLQQALTQARRAVELYPYSEAHQELAHVYWRLAEAGPPGPARTAVTEGLKQVELALRLDADLARAQAIRAGLLLVRARHAEQAGARRESRLQARAALARAVELNPLLRREYEPSLREAEAPLDADAR
ncbi:serine/threonine protein kinase, partial [Pyxidicoccus sp. 3LFB2]